MKKSELIKILVKEVPTLPREAINAVVDMFFDRITDALDRGERVEIRGFGTIQAKERGSRRVKIPNRKRSFTISPRRVPTFKASRELLFRLNRK